MRTGLFPLIKDPKTINRRLDGEVKNEREKEYCSVLTVEEEDQLVGHIKNKNRSEDKYSLILLFYLSSKKTSFLLALLLLIGKNV